MKPAYYNEYDKYAAQWLRNLIAAGHIAPGVVDDRSILDVHPDDLREFAQCHFFAGIGVWSLALRRAGWSDDRPVWTGSCPCQPFSAAGAGAGFADERHLWPHFHHLIGERRPAIVLGEQVASRDADPWIDLVQDDLEGLGYRVGAVPFPSAGVGAPHIRDRLYWVAHASGARLEKRERVARVPGGSTGRGAGQAAFGASVRDAGGLGDAVEQPRQRIAGSVLGTQAQVDRQGRADGRGDVGPEHAGAGMGSDQPAPTNGLWRDADWLGCRDGKFRPVEPGTFPLVNGASARVGRLRAYGNAINASAAEVFIQAVMECMP